MRAPKTVNGERRYGVWAGNPVGRAEDRERCAAETGENMKKIAILGMALMLVGCSNDAAIVSQNISNDAQNFKIVRRIVFYNGITNDYILSVEGLCSIDDGASKKISVTCKVSEGNYKKHYLHISDNVTYFSEQMEAAASNASRYKVTFKPSVIVPDISVR